LFNFVNDNYAPKGYFAKILFDFIGKYDLFENSKGVVSRKKEFVCIVLNRIGKIKDADNFSSSYIQYFDGMIKTYNEWLSKTPSHIKERLENYTL
jgi:hypothetical protein